MGTLETGYLEASKRFLRIISELSDSENSLGKGGRTQAEGTGKVWMSGPS